MKKILILTAGFGEGHNTAARALAESLSFLDSGCQPFVIDLFKECYPRLFRLTSRAYLMAINEIPSAWASIYRLLDRQKHVPRLPRFRKISRRITQLLKEKPHAIVATYPAYPPLISRLSDRLSTPLITVVTDSITINHIWHAAEADFYITPNEETSNVLRERGVSPEIIYNLGFPVSRRFGLIRPTTLPNPEIELRVLYAINSGRHRARRIIEQLLALPRLKLTVLTGRDEKLHNRLWDATQNTRERCSILSWTDEIPRLMAEHHLLISKAGGATTQEAIASGIPMIIHQIVPGQEAGNAKLILNNGWGFHTPRLGQMLDLIERLRANNGKLLLSMRQKIKSAARPLAADEAARFILQTEKSRLSHRAC